MKLSSKDKDEMYMYLAMKMKVNSRCYKRQLGALLVTESGLVFPGFNGPPEKVSDCGGTCPRLELGHGENMKVCRAVHAERLPLLMCAKAGVSTRNAILYSYMGVPCKDCMLELITAGVGEIVCIDDSLYDELSGEILKEWMRGGGKFRVIKMEK